MLHSALIGLGSNLGDSFTLLGEAIERLATDARIEVVEVSGWIESLPIGGPSGQSAFINGAAKLATDLSAAELLAELHSVENLLGRSREVDWGPRTIDLDLLLFGQEIIATPALVVPHPRMAVRSFVLAPATEVAGDWLHPWIGSPLGELWKTWRDGVDAVGLVGDAATRTSLRVLVTEVFPALQTAVAAGSVADCELELIAVSQPLVEIAKPRLTICARHNDAIGLPTLCVDLADTTMSRRDVAAALIDAWPSLGESGGSA